MTIPAKAYEKIDFLLENGLDRYYNDEEYYFSDLESDLDDLCVEVSAGTRRMAFIFEDFDYAIKTYLPRASADGCKDFDNECEFYAMACDEELEEFFAKVELFWYKGVLYALQPKVRVAGWEINAMCASYYEGLAQEYSDEYYEWMSTADLDELDINEVLEGVYGPDISTPRLWRLIDFFEKTGINDLHGNNFGFLPNGDLVLIDYVDYTLYDSMYVN